MIQLADALRVHAQEATHPDELVRSACQWLYTRRIVIPGPRRLKDWARDALAVIEASVLAHVSAAVPVARARELSALAYCIRSETDSTHLEWLKTPPRRHGPASLAETLGKVRFLKALGADTWDLSGVTLAKQQAYARQVQARCPARTREIKPSRQMIELVCFLRITLLELTDVALLQSSRRSQQLFREATHGYTNPAMAIAKLLGFDLCPRLRDLAERKLHLPRVFRIPEGLEAVTVRSVSLGAIERGWDELLRLAASIRSGRVSATLALQRFGSAAQGDPLHRVAEHLGRLLRTVFLCDYIAIEDFRREIHTLLNRGESVHQLQRAVYSGKVAPERGRRRDEMLAISGSHALLTNIVLAWNTSRMHEVVERLKRQGTRIEDDWLRRIGPAHFSHINFRGTMKFNVEKYADTLVQRRPNTRHAPSSR
ncbi:Tn3 family transposase [Variovorax sp. J31P207]|nr:Tn3 family transposase [Variovorax sp. J31P207]MDM0071618.1 Tn3 family transposase [Variovorax sp. J31P207]